MERHACVDPMSLESGRCPSGENRYSHSTQLIIPFISHRHKSFSMSEQTSFLTPLVTQLGVGGVIGLCMGYAVKKVAKIVAAIIGLFALGLIYLESQGLISVDWLGVQAWGNTALSGLGQMEGVLGVLISNLPFAGGAIVGFGIGIKMG